MGDLMDRIFLLAASTRGLPIWARYGATALLVVAILGLRLLLFGTNPAFPFLLFFPTVILSAMLFDRGTAIFDTLFSALLGLWFIIEPARSHPIPVIFDPSLSLLVFVAVGLFTAFLLEAWHVAFETLADNAASLEAANAKLASMAEERTTLLSEAVHRARNDLQRLAAMLRMQATAAEEPARRALDEAAARISALARINRRLDRYRDDSRAEVDSAEFLEGLVEDLREAAVGLRPVVLRAEIEAHPLPLERAVPIGLIVNELVGNALKYAFPDGQEGVVRIGLLGEGNNLVLTVADNGVGFDPAAPARGGGLGSRLSRVFAGQLGGHIALGRPAPCDGRPGVLWTIRFPKDGRGN